MSLEAYGGNVAEEVLTKVVPTFDGGFILHIETNSVIGTGNIDSLCAPINQREIFVKYNSNASIMEWSKCYGWAGDSFINYIFPNVDGNFILGGEFNSNVGWGFFISKQNADGQVLWQKNYSRGNGAIIRDMIQTKDNGYIVLGESLYTDSNVSIHYGSFMDPDLWILRLDSNGNKVWSKVIGGTGYESGASLVNGPGGGCYVIGGTGSDDYDCTGNHGGGEVYLARLDIDGNLLWHLDLGGTMEDVGIHACANSKGGVLIAAETRSDDGDVHGFVGETDYWIIEVDSSANILWNKCYGTSTSYEVPYAICKAKDGSIWINGSSNITGGDVNASYGHGDAWILHTDSVGDIINSRVLGGSQQDEGYMIYPLSNNFVIAGGYYTNNDGDLSSLGYFGALDAFLTVLAPWSTGVTNSIFENCSIAISPNPTSDILNIKWDDRIECEHTVEIYDLTGKIMCKREFVAGVHDASLNVSEFGKGVYVVQVLACDGNIERKKLLIR